MKNENPLFFDDLSTITPVYVLSFESSGVIVHINDTFAHHLGFDKSELVHQKRFEDIVSPGSKILFHTNIFPLLKFNGQVEEIYLSFLSKNLEEIPVLLNFILKGGENHFVIHSGGMKISNRQRFERDLIEARKIAEEALSENKALVMMKMELEKNQQAMEAHLGELSNISDEYRQLSVVLSHDLQEPLRKINLFSSRLRDQFTPDTGVFMTSSIGKINDEATRMSNLVSGVQKFLEIKDKKVTIEKINLAAVMAEAIELQDLHKDQSIEIEHGDLGEINADHSVLVQVMVELISNSVKFRDPEKTLLKISVKADRITQNIFTKIDGRYKYEPYLRLTYTDNGLGFDNSFAQEVFDLFRKYHVHQPGAGLGLAYCRKVLALLNGRISAGSVKNMGTTTTILLPDYVIE